jgi:hypothetical protein
MLARELVETICARLDLARRKRELRRLQREFPPRHGASSFWPALVLVALGAGGAMWKLFIDQPQIIRASMLRQPLPPLRHFPADRERP